MLFRGLYTLGLRLVNLYFWTVARVQKKAPECQSQSGGMTTINLTITPRNIRLCCANGGEPGVDR